MPIQVVYKDGKKYYKYGESGKAYPTREQAEQQMKAMYAAGYRNKNKDGNK